MARMLGHDAYYHQLDRVGRAGHRLIRRTGKRAEQRAVRREVDAFPDDLSEGAPRRIAQYAWETGTDALYDWSDCRHGCNGDCVTGGASERCTFVCHGGVCDVDHERAVEYISRFADSN